MSPFAYMDWLTAFHLMSEGQFSPVEYVHACLDRINKIDGLINSFLHICKEEAIASAVVVKQNMDQGNNLGLIQGIPFGLKDIIDVEGLPTTAHSKILKDNIAHSDAEITKVCRNAGGILLGKLATYEFATGGPSFDLPWPPARNPWRTDCIPGGSSSGPAAAVAAGLIPIAIGTDTSGSLRNPATACGIVGMKPTYGLVSRRGIFPLSFSLDHVGPLTRTVSENAAALNVMASFDPNDPGSIKTSLIDYTMRLNNGVENLRLGIIRHFFEQDLEACTSMQDAINDGINLLQNLGACVDNANTYPLNEFSDCCRIILFSEAYAIHEKGLKERPGDYGALTRRRLLTGSFLRAVDYIQAIRKRTLLCAAIDELFEDFDVLVTASSMEPPFPIKDEDAIENLAPRHARTPFSLTGHPALSLPIGFTEDGLPLAMQIIGRTFDEVTVYQVAAAYERVTKWHKLHPPL